MRAVLLISRTVLIEAVRRKEVYAIVLLSLFIIGAVMSIDFFNMRGLSKFYCEVALQVMSVATALTTIVLAARQLPREFESRTVYPLLAKPVSRAGFLLGKVLGVMFAAAFCFGLFMAVYVVGATWLRSQLSFALLGQYVYLQLVMMLILATLCFWLSLRMNLDAAITIGAILYFTSSVLMGGISFVYDYVNHIGQRVLVALTFILPQLRLFDLGEKAVHCEAWKPLSAGILLQLTLYGGVYAAAFFGLAYLSFRKKPL